MDTFSRLLQNESFGEIWAKHRSSSVEYMDGDPVFTFYVKSFPFLMRIHMPSGLNISNIVEGFETCLEKRIPAFFLRTKYDSLNLKETEFEAHYTRIIPLSATLKEIYRRFEKDTRRLINQAEGKEVQVKLSASRLEFDCWWKLYVKMTAKKKIMREKYEHVYELYAKKFAKLFLACSREKIIAGHVILLGDENALWWLGAYNEVFATLHPNYKLQWEIIKWLKQKKSTYYDMGGITRSPGHGPSLFKSGFGGLLASYFTYRFVLDPMYYKIIDLLIKIKKTLSKKW